MKDIKDRLKTAYEYLKSKGTVHTQKGVSIAMDVSGVTVSRAFNGNKDYLTENFAIKFCATFPQINKDWLWEGKGEMLKGENPYDVNHDRRGTPYFDVDFTNGFDLVCNDQSANPTYYIDFQQYDNADCWVNATGDSMKPLINHGDIIALKQLGDWATYLLYGEIYAIVTDEFRTIKKVRKSVKGDKFIRLVPLNIAEFDEQDIPKDTIRSVFQVLGCAKKIF